MRTCKFCGGKFNIKWGRSYCSSDCRIMAAFMFAKDRAKARMKRECIQCGKFFMGFKRSRFCSDHCRSESMVKLHPCKICGAIVPRDRASSPYCSPGCYQKAKPLIRNRKCSAHSKDFDPPEPREIEPMKDGLLRFLGIHFEVVAMIDEAQKIRSVANAFVRQQWHQGEGWGYVSGHFRARL